MTDPVIPDESTLTRQQLFLSNQKLELENKKLEADLKPEGWWSLIGKRAITFGAIVTAFTTAFGIFISYNKTLTDRESGRAAEQRARFENTLRRLEQPTVISKLIGVSALNSYLSDQSLDVRRQALFALATFIAAERDPQVGLAAIDIAKSVPNDGPVTPEDWAYFQAILVSQNRALSAKGNLYSERQQVGRPPSKPEELAASALGTMIAVNARKGRVPNFSDYRGVYCVNCDFRNASFPDHTDFTGAILDNSNFFHTTLRSASFDNAELAGSAFVEADLSGAKFRSLNDQYLRARDNADQAPAGNTEYLNHLAVALKDSAQIRVRMPNFACSNLREANFDNHALFPSVQITTRTYLPDAKVTPAWYQSVPSLLIDPARSTGQINLSPLITTPPKFFKANLANTRMDKVRYFVAETEYVSLRGQQNGSPSTEMPVMVQYGADHLEDNVFDQLNVEPAGAKKLDDDLRSERRAINRFQTVLRASFFGFIGTPKLSPSVSDFLKKSPPTTGAYKTVFRFDDADLRCTPRQ